MNVLFFAYICTLKINLKTIIDMKKIIATLLLAAACTCAFGQSVKDSIWDDDDHKISLGDSKWDLGATFGVTYNYSFNAPSGLSNSGLGLDLSLFEMQWNGWKGGSLTLGILDFIFDWQFLLKGNAFTGTDGGIVPAADGKGYRSDVTFGFPVGINQQFGKDFGISLIAVPGVGLYRYNNDYILAGVHHEDSLYPTKGRVGFRLNLKAIIWYNDFGVLVRYQPLASPDMNTTVLSVGIALR